jgi:Protein of unknown function (DUF1360)
MTDQPVLRFVLVLLCVWRVTHLLVFEDGPWDAVIRLRKHLGSSVLGQAMDCFYCCSLWVAAPFALLSAASPLEGLLVWLASSGGACVLEHLTDGSLGQKEVINGLLWSAPSIDDGQAGSSSE